MVHGYTMVMPWLSHRYIMVIPWLYLLQLGERTDGMTQRCQIFPLVMFQPQEKDPSSGVSGIIFRNPSEALEYIKQ